MYLLKHATGAPTNSIIEFTFHYVSIKTMKILFFTLYLLHLHSTMYLLKHFVQYNRPQIYPHLHSTMYLLKHNNPTTIQCYSAKFTFHYVSIKTNSIWITFCLGFSFTFHYVSIKTENPGNIISIDVSFTFHYVSIKTLWPCTC